MNVRWQIAGFILIVLISIALTRTFEKPSSEAISSAFPAQASEKGLSQFSFEGTALAVAETQGQTKKPARKWEVLDPNLTAAAVLLHSLDDDAPLFYRNTYKRWPAASLSKLLAALVVLEDIGANKKIPISQKAVDTEGEAGGLKSGEVYTARDLLQIMILTSSNDAAAAFEEYGEGKENFMRLMARKTDAIGMTQSVFHDASGLSDLNETTATDMFKLLRYVAERIPQILEWSRLSSFLVQPMNDVTSRTITNIMPFVNWSTFLGGKTGTSSVAKENLVAIFSAHHRRIALVLLGSENRVQDTELLFRWLETAYEW